MPQAAYATARRRGNRVMMVLAAATAVEFWVGTTQPPHVLAYLAALAGLKAGLIVDYFMHLPQLFDRDRT